MQNIFEKFPRNISHDILSYCSLNDQFRFSQCSKGNLNIFQKNLDTDLLIHFGIKPPKQHTRATRINRNARLKLLALYNAKYGNETSCSFISLEKMPEISSLKKYVQSQYIFVRDEALYYFDFSKCELLLFNTQHINLQGLQSQLKIDHRGHLTIESAQLITHYTGHTHNITHQKMYEKITHTCDHPKQAILVNHKKYLYMLYNVLNTLLSAEQKYIMIRPVMKELFINKCRRNLIKHGAYSLWLETDINNALFKLDEMKISYAFENVTLEAGIDTSILKIEISAIFQCAFPQLFSLYNEQEQAEIHQSILSTHPKTQTKQIEKVIEKHDPHARHCSIF